jgi:cell division protein FtsQ
VSAIAAALARGRPLLRRALPSLSARLKRRLLALVMACLVLAGGYQFWLRDSSLVAVERVTVSGLTTADSERVRMALAATARGMTTLHVDRERLERAVAPYPVVRGLEITTDFPHGMTVRVIEHEPAAIAVGDDGRVPVAGDGTILHGLPVAGRLPTLEVDGALGEERLRDPAARAAATVAGTAPKALRKRIEQVEERSRQGLVAELRDGPELIFGTARRARAKWAAAARVLADPQARGASYVDLRIPGRPAAGGLPAQTVAPVAPAGQAAAPLPQAGGAASGTASGGAGAAAQGAPPASGDPASGATGQAPAGTTPSPAAPPAGAAPAPQSQAPAAQPQPPVSTGAEGGATAPAQP